MTDYIEEAMKIADEWCPEYRHGLGGDIAAALAEKDKIIAELERDKQAMISAIKHYSGSDDVVFGVQHLVSRATAAETEVARLRSELEDLNISYDMAVSWR